MPFDAGSEFGFELRICAWAERAWPPGDENTRPVIVARQLGTRRRRWDTVVVEVDPDALERRRQFGKQALDGDLLHVVRNAPREWTYYRDALPEPDYPWRYVREAIHTASDRGAIDSRKRGGRIEIRRIAPYPSWITRLVAVENKPDLDASAARALRSQLERDVALGLADEVWLATESTAEPVPPALLEPVPVEVGILTLDRSGAEVVWRPGSLDPEGKGTEILERPDGRGFDQSAARFEYRSGAEKRIARLEIAERAYERGWRSYIDSMRPDCRHFEMTDAAFGFVPVCTSKDREQTAAECSSSCEYVEPEPPAWRQMGWPIEGGPGKTVRRILEERRARRR
ncbi:MAG: DUF5787 family protein [Halodesulfurarchaeum sp.]